MDQSRESVNVLIFEFVNENKCLDAGLLVLKSDTNEEDKKHEPD